MMNKKIISLLLVFSIVFSTSIPAFAGSVTISPQNDMSYTQGEQNKSISYIGENKLVVWEEGDTVYAEQYDLKGNLIVSCKGNRKNDEITMVSKKSDIFSNTVKYIITDEESNKLNEVYYDGGSYYDPYDDSHTLALMQYIVPNLYGLDYEWNG
ncbi:MAG: hypothetical protein KH355_13265 [Clostridiales bacterium]|nr:hypothetical protein [Clostridiales bacterium]